MTNRAIGLAVAFCCVLSTSASADVTRHDFSVSSAPGIELFVRRVATDARSANGPILLIHGARVGALASFDVDVPGYSLAADLAQAGHTVYLADVRGYGRSTFPPSMTGNRFSGAPAVPTAAAVHDLRAVLLAIRKRHPKETLTAMGWATGSYWLAATEASHPGSIDRLIFYNSVYGGKGSWALTKLFAKPDAPSEFNYPKFGRYRLSTAESLVGRWAKSDAISQAFVRRYVELAMEGDPTVNSRTPPSFRHPSGPIADTLKAVHEAPLYDARKIRSHVLILRSGEDFWSRPVDVENFKNDLTGARSIATRQLPGASHYVHLEPGPRRQELLSTIIEFSEVNATSN